MGWRGAVGVRVNETPRSGWRESGGMGGMNVGVRSGF